MLYPKQSASRMVFDLGGVWNFQLGDVDCTLDPAKPLATPETVAVPASYNDQKPDRAWRDH